MVAVLASQSVAARRPHSPLQCALRSAHPASHPSAPAPQSFVCTQLRRCRYRRGRVRANSDREAGSLPEFPRQNNKSYAPLHPPPATPAHRADFLDVCAVGSIQVTKASVQCAHQVRFRSRPSSCGYIRELRAATCCGGYPRNMLQLDRLSATTVLRGQRRDSRREPSHVDAQFPGHRLFVSPHR